MITKMSSNTDINILIACKVCGQMFINDVEKNKLCRSCKKEVVANSGKYGIYQITSRNKKLLYVGIDKHFKQNKRLNDHLSTNNYFKQVINAFLQDKEENKDWYYYISHKWLSQKYAKKIESEIIKFHDPIYNKILSVKE